MKNQITWTDIFGPGLGGKILLSILLPLILVGFYVSAESLGWPSNDMGIQPRKVEGLSGILFWTILHGDELHLIGNCTSLFMTLLVGLLLFPNHILWAGLWSWFAGGLATWGLATSGVHIGASGVLYGLIAFMLVAGFARKSRASIATALIVLMLNQGFFAGFAPQAGISWEGHLGGALVGAALALYWRPLPGRIAREDTPGSTPPEQGDDDDDDDGGIPEDVWNYRK